MARTVRVAVQVRPASGADAAPRKHAVVLVQLTNLRRANDKVRDHILEDLRAVLAELLAPDDDAVVGVRGAILYGAMGARRAMEADEGRYERVG